MPPAPAGPEAPSAAAILRPLVALAAPMLLGQAGQVAIQLVDTAFVGRLGAVPLAAAALAGTLVMFALYFAYGIVGAVSPAAARSHGAGARGDVARTARAGALLALLVGIGVALVLSALVPLLGLLGQPPEVTAAAGGYLVLLAWSMPAAILALVLGQVAEAVDRPWPVFAFLALAVALNALLAWGLVFGHAGMPALGLAGAGWATFIARWVQAAALGAWVLGEPRLSDGTTPWRVPEWRRVAALFRAGLPVAAQDVLEGGAFAVGTLFLGRVGTEALAANMVTVSIASLAWMVPVALATATSVRVAQAVGAGDRPAARRTALAAVILGAGLMAGCAVVYVGGGAWLARLFTDDPRVAALAGTLVSIAGVYQISDAIQSVSLGSLRGLSDNRVPMIANAVCYWLLSLPTVWWLTFGLGWGAAGVWVGYLPWMVGTGLFFLTRFLRLTADPRAGGKDPGATSSRSP